jgi:GntR family transcriptional repressor for pyruvate dehydrogenase complex
MPYEDGIFHTVEMDENTLPQNVAQQIRGLILSGELKAGDRLPAEHELCDRLGVSRTVIREAVKLLKAASLLKGRMGVGTYVTHPSMNVLRFSLQNMQTDYKILLADLQQVRLALEPALAAMAAQNANEEQINALELAVEKMQANLSDPGRYIEVDNVFHLTLAKAAGNSVLEIFVSATVDLLHQTRKLAIQDPDAIHRSNFHHVEILEAVKARDSQLAFRAMESHIYQINDSIKTATQHLEQPEIARYLEQVS